MSILNNMLKAFSSELDYNKECFKANEEKRQANKQYNMIDILDEIETNVNIIRNKRKNK